jgi:hypothetical protein
MGIRGGETGDATTHRAEETARPGSRVPPMERKGTEDP